MLWVLAVILVIVGVVQLLQGQLLFALLLFVAAALVGPGGYQIGRGASRLTSALAAQLGSAGEDEAVVAASATPGRTSST